MSWIRAACPHCQNALRIPADWVGRTLQCKQCQTRFRVPATDSAEPTKPLATPQATSEATKQPQPPTTSVPIPPTSGGNPRKARPLAPLPPRPPEAVVAPPAIAPVPVFPAPAHLPTPTVVIPPSYSPSEALPDFIPSETTQRYRGPKRGVGAGVIWGLFALILMISGAVAGIWFSEPIREYLRGNAEGASADSSGKTATTSVPNPSPAGGLASVAQKYPRRMLFVSVSKYLYCNPLSVGNSKNPDMVGIAARRLAFQWKVPQERDQSQCFVVQDAGPQARPMEKPVVEAAFREFSQSSREQDRIWIYFGGHAALIDGKAYLVPAEGDLSDPATLVPISSLFEPLQASRAAQKIVVLDVCRLNENGDRLRPGSEPMSAELHAALTTAPEGVQVVTTAGPNEQALEFQLGPADAPNEGGSLFLSSIIELAAKGRVKSATNSTPDDALPLQTWLEAIQSRMNDVAKSAGRPAAKLHVRGSSPTQLTPANETAAAAPGIQLPPKPTGLPPADIVRLLGPIAELPPYRGQLTADDRVELLMPFQEAVLSNYQPPEPWTLDELQANKTQRPHRYLTMLTLSLIKKEWRSSAEGATELRTMIQSDVGDELKKAIIAEQETPARIEGELEEKLIEFDKLAKTLDVEPSVYWKVMFQYTHAQLKARLAFMSEYNLALGSIRTDNLPKVDASQGQSGLVLISSEKMRSKKEVREMAEEAKELFLKVATEHPNTPWAVLARRHAVMGLGLEWKPYVSGNASALDGQI